MVVSTADFITWAISCVSSSSSLLLFRIYPFWPSHSAYRSKWADWNSKPLKEYRDDAKHTWKHWNNILCINSIVMTRATQKYTIAFGPCLIDQMNTLYLGSALYLYHRLLCVCVLHHQNRTIYYTFKRQRSHRSGKSYSRAMCVILFSFSHNT